MNLVSAASASPIDYRRGCEPIHKPTGGKPSGGQGSTHRSTVGGSYAPVIMGTDEDPLWLWRKRRKRGDQPEDLSNCRCYGANAGPAPLGSNIGAVFCVNAAFFLGRLLRRIVQILLLLASGTKRLRNSARDRVSSNQLARLNAQEKLK